MFVHELFDEICHCKTSSLILPDLSLESVTLGLSFLVGKAGEEVMVTRECLDDVLPMFTLLKIPWMSDDQNNNILDPKTGEVKVGSF